MFAEVIDHRSRVKMIHHRPTVYTYRPVMLSKSKTHECTIDPRATTLDRLPGPTQFLPRSGPRSMVKVAHCLTLNLNVQISSSIIKSPQYTGGDFMFLYRFVRRRRRRRRRRRPQILVHAITFERLFGFLSFLAQLLARRLPDYILVDFRRDLDLHFSRSNMEFAISQPKMVRLPRNEKQTYRLNSRAQMWPSGLTLAMTLTLNFQGQI